MRLFYLISLTFMYHGVIFISIFDTFFNTPMYDGLPDHSSPSPPPAKRVVFIIADGLRADKVLMLKPDGKSPAPFLRNIIEKQGAWGIAHARPPTATRPGHVALTAGFYEDPTSVAKDIQGKAIIFDTIFNETKYTWSWDTPKFLQKVTGGNANRMYSKTFPGDMKYLAGIDAREMDTWVFEQVKEFLETAKKDPTTLKKTQESQVLYFLHLGGLDHNGYIVRPSHQSYMDHVTMVDKEIETVVKRFEEYYQNDGQTAYVFASDHGMTDWGGHGDGSPDETLTPLIAWGPGIRHPSPETRHHKDGLSRAWKLDKFLRTDMNQASMAPFLAALLAVPYPKNAVHPVPHQLFNLTDHDMSEMLFANLRQLTEQYLAALTDRTSKTLTLAFAPFELLSPEKCLELYNSIKSLIVKGKFPLAISKAKEGIKLTLEGIEYYRTYDRVLLWCSIALGFVGWMIYLGTHLAERMLSGGSSKLKSSSDSFHVQALFTVTFMASALLTFIFLYVQSAPVLYFVYILPVFPTWLMVTLRFRYIQESCVYLSGSKNALICIVLAVVGLELTAFSYYWKEICSLILVCFATWPIVYKQEQLEKHILAQWSMSCLGLALFPFLLTKDRAFNFNILVLSGILLLIAASILAKKCISKSLSKRKLTIAFGLQLSFVAIATIVAKSTAVLADANTRTPLINQILSWTILVVSLVIPFFMPTDLRTRLLTTCLSILAPYILFTVAHEGMYLMVLCWNLCVFLLMESRLNNTETVNDLPTTVVENGVNGKTSPRRVVENGKWFDNVDLASLANLADGGTIRQTVRLADIRRAFYFIFLSTLSLYGTGYIPSVASFDAAAVYCFLTVSNPPFMGTLIVLKIIMPTMIIWCFMKIMSLLLQVSYTTCSIITILMADILTLTMYLLVTDSGTFEEMGKTLGHFIISMAINLVMLLLYGSSHLLATSTFCCRRKL